MRTLVQNLFRSTSLLALAISIPIASPARAQVQLQKNKNTWQLLRNGEPYWIQGVGGDTHLDLLASLGGNSIRTWGVDDRTEQILDEAHRNGLSVCVGIWLGHQRHGFSYNDQAAVLKQLDESLAAVRKYRDHPAVLLWGVGNEMEGLGNDPAVWYAVNHIASEIKRIDPNHPTMTVIAELGGGESKLKSIERFCPSIDIVGVNSYGGMESVGQRYSAAGISKPYIVTEHGTHGPWEVGKTSWGVPIESTSSEKALSFHKGYQASVASRRGQCLGSYAFLWGHKQETTATWFGMLLPDGSRLGAVDAMSKAWTGKTPANRCPTIKSLSVGAKDRFQPGDSFDARVVVEDPEDDSLTYEWVLRSDSGTIGVGGDRQDEEKQFKSVDADGDRATITLPKKTGGYRVFVYVRDSAGGAAVANIPIHVDGAPMPAPKLAASKLPYSVYGEDLKSNVYIPSGVMGNTGAVAMTLDSTDSPHTGKTCLKAEYKAADSWGGVLWQSPPDDWEGQQPGGANLSGATHLEFWARGADGGERVNFVFGVIDRNKRYGDTAKGEIKDAALTKQWNRFTIPLKGLDLRRIKTGFGWSLAGQGKPVTFYLDDIRYVKE